MAEPLIPRHMSNGGALWGTHALWVTALEAWWQQRNGQAGEEPESWRGIEFDKLAHFLHLIWRALYERKLVTFDSAYMSAGGVHGPGPALPRAGEFNRHVPALDAIYHIQDALKDNPDIHLFDLATSKYAGKIQYQVRPGRERTWLPMHLSDTLPPVLRKKDPGFFRALIEMTTVFSREELRALGTHQSKEGTIEAIEYNVFIHLFKRLMDETRDIETPGWRKKRGSALGQSDLPPLVSVANEIERKSKSNRGAYAEGWRKLKEAADTGNEVATVAIEDVYSAPDDIWTEEVTKWEQHGEQMNGLLTYLKALRNVCIPPKEPEDDEARQKLAERLRDEKDAGEAGARRVAAAYKVSVPPLPSRRADSFPWNRLRSAIVEVFDSLPGSTQYLDAYNRFAENYRGVA